MGLFTPDSCIVGTSVTGPTGLCNGSHHGQPDSVELVREAGGTAISSVGDSMGMAGDSVKALIPEHHTPMGN